MKQDNKGFSLVELVIVLAIMAILITIGVRNLGVLDTYRCRECQTAIVSALQNNKVYCLSKSYSNTSDVTSADTYLQIKYENKKVYLVTHVKGADTKTEVISKGSNTEVGYRKTSGSNIVYLADNGHIEIGFNRSSGAYLPTSGTDYYTNLYVKTGNKVRDIKLETKTGKVTTN